MIAAHRKNNIIQGQIMETGIGVGLGRGGWFTSTPTLGSATDITSINKEVGHLLLSWITFHIIYMHMLITYFLHYIYNA